MLQALENPSCTMVASENKTPLSGTSKYAKLSPFDLKYLGNKSAKELTTLSIYNMLIWLDQRTRATGCL